MAGSIPAASGRIFISYRREETAYPAGWLYDRLADRFGSDQIFKDVDSIELGDDFVEVITTAVGACDVLLAVIGREWLTITDAQGRRRLESPDDFVRLEIEAALSRRVRVIPILVDGASMPRADELPDSLATLVRRQALDLSPARFDFDTGRLLKVLDRTLAEVRTEHDDAASMREALPTTPSPIRAASTQGTLRPGAPLNLAAGSTLVLKHSRVVRTAAFSPDGRLLATTSPGKIRIWDAATGQERIQVPVGLWVRNATFSPDGRLLATIGLWQTKVRIWALSTRGTDERSSS